MEPSAEFQDQAESCFKQAIQEQTSSDTNMKIVNQQNNENNSSNNHSNNIDHQRTTASSQSTAGGQEQTNSESIDDTKERLQRFDLVIQHLHRLRATLALDSSVRELQKLQTLNILGQNLLPHHPHTVPPPGPGGHHGKMFKRYFYMSGF